MKAPSILNMRGYQFKKLKNIGLKRAGDLLENINGYILKS